ncbi:MAG: hypothetical protein CVU44_01520 [Chloroflexi bacterium HGW-Chloroflexi-6]|nr:MAG: hypothetical protein CVU44_01520 [Chloroflexi bacterium HGW-Chloroflexi-6]
MTPKFIQGIQFCGLFYAQVVRPLLQSHFPQLEYSAALLGSGSEILGYDTPMSSDHHWGPRVMLFVREAEMAVAPDIHQMLAENLPYTFLGYSTHFSEPDPNDNGVQHLTVVDSGPVNHRVTVQTTRSLLTDYLGIDDAEKLSPVDWLSLPQQKLLTLTAGAVYHDGIGLEALRKRLSWYPQDVWLYLLAAGWARIGQEEHLMGRAGLVGDEVGSALIGARLTRDIMRLCFLMERRYAPYPKWFGTAFKQLACGAELYPILKKILTAGTWQNRQKYLIPAYEHLARKHNALGLTNPLPETTIQFFGRPFDVIALHGFADALLAQIRDPQLAKFPIIGSVDQWSDNTDLLESQALRENIAKIYS